MHSLTCFFISVEKTPTSASGENGFSAAATYVKYSCGAFDIHMFKSP